MTINSDTLLQRVQQRIFDEGDLQEGLNEVYHCVSAVMPVGKMSWLQFHYDLNMLRVIAQATEIGGEKTNFTYNLPGELIALLCSRDIPEIYLMNHPEKDPLGKEICNRAKLFDWSSLFLNFQNHTGTYGAIMIMTDRKNRYTEAHGRLLSGLKKPLQRVMDALILDNETRSPHPKLKEPVKDKNEFFRQVTRRLCGHLDLQAGVSQCLQYLSRFMPADALFVRQREPEFQSERVLAESYGFFHQQTGTLIPLPIPADTRRTPGIRIINRPEDSSALKLYMPIFGSEICCISMPLIHKERPIGAAVVGLEGRARYTEEHMQLFALLHDPFVLALSNNIRHREVIRLKNLVEEEKKDLAEELHCTAPDTIIGGSLGLEKVMENARLVAGQDSPVLLTGETGVGKEMIANFIHWQSSRKDGPLIKVNCGAIPDTLVDSELFGHEKGAFTGATRQKLGRFERANGGTIFLDEIAELPLPAQVRMLRVLHNKIIERVGGTESIPVDIRIIAATHRNLEERVKAGRFREDLWFRLNVFPIRIPPLRSRTMDVPALSDHFIEKKSRELKIHPTPPLSPDAMARLTAYSWPGNVRELENVIERELILNTGGPLTFQNLSPTPTHEEPAGHDMKTEDILSLDDLFVRHVKKVLVLSNGKINGPGGAAEMMKIKPNTLRNRMKKLGIAYGREKR
ncbi:sigma-54-dependent Fis family transcriptional regulator [Desulfosudis oleivorans]|uniref:Sigma-54 factor interaction domain-containing protein n=1 Tax=Desulfosudis oleivorans (strain DSM 6200 / JCM 39069 / Hxd3) TaxID=96561 RepID=A8ZZQ7_DESOH|nr:sigma-54-dependent Fis family transcriptional regulator [Desulfosudis oleivorans]ABW68929.1 sigma-54 factor interaction domain-containing protein [Desulfosudis oleivorans Hxd3]